MPRAQARACDGSRRPRAVERSKTSLSPPAIQPHLLKSSALGGQYLSARLAENKWPIFLDSFVSDLPPPPTADGASRCTGASHAPRSCLECACVGLSVRLCVCVCACVPNACVRACAFVCVCGRVCARMGDGEHAPREEVARQDERQGRFVILQERGAQSDQPSCQRDEAAECVPPNTH